MITTAADVMIMAVVDLVVVVDTAVDVVMVAVAEVFFLFQFFLVFRRYLSLWNEFQWNIYSRKIAEISSYKSTLHVLLEPAL